MTILFIYFWGLLTSFKEKGWRWCFVCHLIMLGLEKAIEYKLLSPWKYWFFFSLSGLLFFIYLFFMQVLYLKTTLRHHFPNIALLPCAFLWSVCAVSPLPVLQSIIPNYWGWAPFLWRAKFSASCPITKWVSRRPGRMNNGWGRRSGSKMGATKWTLRRKWNSSRRLFKKKILFGDFGSTFRQACKTAEVDSLSWTSFKC